MKHLRADYDRIQDPFNKIGSDEPVFLLRAQDKAFPAMLMGYIGYQRAIGNEELAKFIEDQMPAVHEWRHTHATHNADIPTGTKPGLTTKRDHR